MSAKEPWFKFWATDYLCDAAVDALPLAAQGLLVRMWCVCSQRGSIPDDAEEIARLTQCKVLEVRQCYLQCKQFFRLHDGLLYSTRMEAEKARSEIARANAQKRYNKQDSGKEDATSTASGRANSNPQKARESECQNGHKARDAEKTLALTAPALPAPPPFLTLPLNDGSEYAITEEWAYQMQSLYPAIDVRQEIRKYKGWAIAKPARRKTRRGILTSVNNWLARSHDNSTTNRKGENLGTNRARQRTDSNIDAAKQAFESLADRDAGVLS